MDNRDPSRRSTIGPKEQGGLRPPETEFADLAPPTVQLGPLDPEDTTDRGGSTVDTREFLDDLSRLEGSARDVADPSTEMTLEGQPTVDHVEQATTSLVRERVITPRQAGEILEAPGRGWTLGHYALRKRLGRGGMGVVYEALDLSRNALVALKVLRNVNPASLHRFKKEFRAHTRLSHPNLIRLYELHSWDGRWFFTMERLDGVDFLRAARYGTAPGEGGTADSPEFDRARRLLAQAVDGLMAIHDAGLLHRDIKGSNILVGEDEHVVILDFGLVADASSLPEVGDSDLSARGLREIGPDPDETDRAIVGTIDYMSPEQASGRPLAPSSDWYSLGVLLYEILAGRRPFQAPPHEVLQAKQRSDPPGPRSIRQGVPDDLNDLCVALLDRRPEARPTGPEILERLRSAGPRLAGPANRPTPNRAGPSMVGRKAELGRIVEVYRDAKAGRAAAVFVAGPSGAGKSTLVAHFLKDAAADGEPLVLAGRCFEQEAVPFKAVDGVVEALARHLRSLPDAEVRALVPESAGLLTQLFPGLARVDAIDALRARQPSPHDPREVRRRAFAAFRELIARISARRVVILAIDDIQWGDLDGALLLVELLVATPTPRVLLIGTCRSGFSESGPGLDALRAVLGGGGVGYDVHELDLAPLGDDEARELASAAIDADGGDRAGSPGLVEAIVREARGDPFAIVELAREAAIPGEAAGDREGRAGVGRVIASRIERLPEGSRRLLEAVALAGGPLPQRSAYRVAGLDHDAWDALMTLRDRRLAISNGLQLDDEVVTAHARVREAVIDRMDADRRKSTHRRLALALESAPKVDPESIAVHFLGADEPDAASDYYEVAADRAGSALAFDRSAKLYDLAALLRAPAGDHGAAFRLKHARALANAGRSVEAGALYARLAREARESGRDPGDHLMRSAYEYTIGGRIDDGVATWKTVLAARGITIPETPGRAIRSVLGEMALLKLRGVRPRLDPDRPAAPGALERIDLLWAAGTGLSMIDPIVAHGFRLRGLRIALGAGDVKRLAFGLASYATILSYSGTSKARQVAEIRRQAGELAERSGDPYTLAMDALMGGFVEFHSLRLRAALDLFRRAEAILDDRCPGLIWEGDTCRLMKLWASVLVCDFDRVAGEWEIHRHHAIDRGNLYAQYNLEVAIGPGIRMARDEPEEARLGMREAMAPWPRGRFLLQHLTWIETEARLDRYLGDGPAAFDRLDREWKTLTRSMAFRSQLSRTLLILGRSLSAVMVAQGSRRPKPLLDLATRGAKRLNRERWAVADSFAEAILGGVEAARKNDEAAIAHYLRCRDLCSVDDMPAAVPSCERKVGELIGGDRGGAMVAEADARLRGLGILNPARFARMITT